MNISSALMSCLLLGACAVDSRGLLSQSHFHTEGPNSVRVELIDMTEFVVQATGDRRGDGELQDMSVSLSAPQEFSIASASNAREIRNLTDPETDALVYVTISRNDRLTYGDSAGYDNASIWVHADREARVTLSVRARDLDCSGERVCGRSDDGEFRLVFDLPRAPERLVSGCPPAQVFEWVVVGGRPGFRNATGVEATSSGRPILVPANGAICIRPVM